MGKAAWAAEVRSIEADSWTLLHFQELPESATPEQIIEAIEADVKWQEDHMDEVHRRVDALITKVEEEAGIE